MQTGNWVREGTSFHLLDGATGELLKSTTASVSDFGCLRSFWADPQPVRVCDGFRFFAVDTATQKTMADLRMAVTDAGCEEKFWADPQTITQCVGTGGETTLHWNVPEVSYIQIRVGSPDGKLLAHTRSQGSVKTGPWVTDGMRFYLLDVATGRVIAALIMRVNCR